MVVACDTDADESTVADEVKSADAAEAVSAKETIEPLTIGSVAPDLDIEYWIQNGNGKFEPVVSFEPGKVYIVEFWATWCGPCIHAMPHLAETQQKYADAGVQVISVSSEPFKTVEKFLEREVPANMLAVPNHQDDGDGDKAVDEAEVITFDQLTSSYCLTCDPDGSTSEDYMQAAARNIIPCAFIVGKDGLIEWIGHPMSMDDTVAAVVDDRWDRSVFASEFMEKQRWDLLHQSLATAKQAGDNEKALTIMDELLEIATDDWLIVNVKLEKVHILMDQSDREEEGQAILQEMLTHESLPSNAMLLLGYRVMFYTAKKRITDQSLARRAAEKMINIVEDSGSLRPMMLDVIARLQNELGEKDAAIKTHKQAVELAGERGLPICQLVPAAH